ncbi:hypothetical protein RHOFW510R12_06515 [Rhodanobacter sp. FW510-R12]|nr:hypothetical protein RHOFW104R8_05185 [Rhodanobacter sp. FW104-R8]KZC25520.1 hypothetical protein RhoFW510T8_06960 [Rhodanobacter sp. FW510-T8]KZC31115.1 hypothetical protein RhoFW510R10_00240 [Rhodanobacter sp. FW510-R10]
MYYVVETPKSFDQAAADLEAAIARNGFGVLHVHDLGATLRGKGVPFEHECKVFEVCNPRQAARVLGVDMRLNMALPCRVSVYTEAGGTRIGMIEPVAMLAMLSPDPALAQVAREVQAVVMRSIDEAGGGDDGKGRRDAGHG